MDRNQADEKPGESNTKSKQEQGELSDDEITQAELAELSARIRQRYVNIFDPDGPQHGKAT